MEQITASAGSGKTYTLTRRFLSRLARAAHGGGPSVCLLAGEGPRREEAPYALAGILAATFTNKAAAEMQARVVRELKQQALAENGGDATFPLTPEEARRWVATILRRFDAVNIRTIDSLLTLLVRLNALSLSLPPDFTPVFSLEETLSPLYDALMDKASGEDVAVERLLRAACRSLLFHDRAKSATSANIVRDRAQELIRLHLDGEELPGDEHGPKITAMFSSLRADLCHAASALTRFVAEENLAVSANARAFLEKCRTCPPLALPNTTDTYATKASLDEWLNKASRGCASNDAYAAFADTVAAYAALQESGPALLTTLEFLPLVALIRPLMAGLEALQREEGLVPAARLPFLALTSLEGEHGVSDAFCRLGETLLHLLFDEFQDTSVAQWRAITPLVIESLSRGGSLTYVGDVKQAIYGWRGGNAALFDAVAKDRSLTAMLDSGPAATALTDNWRSAPAIVAANNSIFGPLADASFAHQVLAAMLPARTPPALLAEAAHALATTFSGCEQNVPEKNAARHGYVRLQTIEGDNAAELTEITHETVRATLLDGLLSRRSPGEIAILTRTNKQAGLVAEWLAAWQVPVVTEHSFRLGSHPLICRLVDTLAFLEYPLDDGAFWSAVSGPELFRDLGAPPEEALLNWLAATRKDPGGPPLFTAFRLAFPRAWSAMLAPFHDQAGLMSAYDTVCELIRHCRLFARYPAHAPFLRRFAEVAHAAETKGHSSLSAFLDYWAESGGNERVPMPETMDAVRIVSMHKAKGLEFPVVIVPFHTQADPTTAPLAIQKRFGLPLISYQKSHEPESVRGIAEQINLLYVAWTRPTEELHAIIARPRGISRSAMGRGLDVLLQNHPFVDGVYEHGTRPLPAARLATHTPATETILPGEALVSERDEATLSAEEPPARLMSWLPRLKIFRNPLDGKGFTERQRGLLAHACLEALRLTGELPSDVARAVDQGLRAFPVPMPDPEAVRRDMAAMLEWYATLPQARIWMRHGSAEQPVMATDGTIRRVDLLVDAPGAPLLAVEYKTGLPTPEHGLQVARYLSLLAPAVRRKEPGRAVEGVIVYLDRKELVPVAEPAPAKESSPGEPR